MFTMTGTTGSTFNGVFSAPRGKMGFRNIGGDDYRVRIEPSSDPCGGIKTLPTLNNGFTRKPQGHYSVVVNGQQELAEALAVGAAALVQGAPAAVPAEVEPEAKLITLPNGTEVSVSYERRKVVEIDGTEYDEEDLAALKSIIQ